MAIDHMVLMASDLEESVRWYTAIFAALGYEKTREHVWLSSNGVAIDLRPAGDPEARYHRYAPGLNHFAVARGSRSEVDAVAAHMREAGFEPPEGQEFPDGYAIFFRDPDGLRLEVGSPAS